MANWYISHPNGADEPLLLSAADVATLRVNFRIMATSTASLTIHRDYDADGVWWAAESVVTIFREAIPVFTGRVIETPIAASANAETRTLELADAWQDLEEIIYQEPWSAGAGSVLIPKAVIGLDANGDAITTGQQIEAVLDYSVIQGAALQIGDIAEGLKVWPSLASNATCASIILGELRWTPDVVAYINHKTVPPTLHCKAAADLVQTSCDVQAENIESFNFAPLVRQIPRGVRLLYEDAATIDGEVYRNGYIDTAGATTGRKIITATIELAGLDMQFQKSRIETRDMPVDAATMVAYFKKKWPELKDMPDAAFAFSNVTKTLAPLAAQPPPVNPKATRLNVTTVDDLPRELVRGQIEDWMKKKVGQVTVKYDLRIVGNPNAEQRKVLENFRGEGKTFTVTCTNAVTKIYKGVTSFAEGEDRPIGIAQKVFEAATRTQYEGSITLADEEADGTQWAGLRIRLADGGAQLMPGMVVHSCSIDVGEGKTTVNFGPLPYLSAGDFMELQRMVKGRPVTWMSKAERTSNQLGAELKPGAKGDTVSGYDMPDTIVPPGGAAKPNPFELTLIKDESEYRVTVAKGVVFQRKMAAELAQDAASYHEPTNRLTDGVPTEFVMEIGEAIFVKVTDDTEGKIDPAVPVVLVVAADDTKSLIYIPGTQVGEMYYKLAKLVADGASAKLELALSGSHIFHQSGLTGDVRITQCPDPESSDPPVQLLRISFVSGAAVAFGKTLAERPLADAVEETSVYHCT